jgi:hypothetical protein
MKFWSRATRILLATIVASQGAVFLPAMAASQGKKLAVKAIGIEELKSEYGAGGGGGGTDPAKDTSTDMVNDYQYTRVPYIPESTKNCVQSQTTDCKMELEKTAITSAIQFVTITPDEYVTRYHNTHGTNPMSATHPYDPECTTEVSSIGILDAGIGLSKICTAQSTITFIVDPKKSVNVWRRKEKAWYEQTRTYVWYKVKGGTKTYDSVAGTGVDTIRKYYWVYFAGLNY